MFDNLALIVRKKSSVKKIKDFNLIELYCIIKTRISLKLKSKI